MNITTYTIDEYIKGTHREAQELITKHIKRIISSNNIKEKSPEWYLLYQLKTMVDEDRELLAPTKEKSDV